MKHKQTPFNFCYWFNTTDTTVLKSQPAQVKTCRHDFHETQSDIKWKSVQQNHSKNSTAIPHTCT